MKNSSLEELIEELITCDELWCANYYISSMKKTPHGGVFNINTPNFYIKHMKKNTFNIFKEDRELFLQFFSELFKDVIIKIENFDINLNDIANLIFKEQKSWYIAFRLLKPKKEYEERNKSIPLIFEVINKNLKIEDYFILDKKIITYGFICWIIDNDFVSIIGLPQIKKYENLIYNPNKYGLSKLNDVEFFRQGYIYNGKYYLYNIFLDTSILEANDNVPGTIKIILRDIENVDFRMRIDKNLSIDKNKFISTSSFSFQVFRGIEFNINDIEKIVFSKEIIVHFNPESFNKLIMIIKPDKEENEKFYHIEIEELWNCDNIKDEIILTNFIHSKYYPSRKAFNHIDFSVNQYDYETYKLKYMDSQNITGVAVDKYSNTHYKVWCVEAEKIAIETWSKLVSITLDDPFRELFSEIIKKSE